MANIASTRGGASTESSATSTQGPKTVLRVESAATPAPSAPPHDHWPSQKIGRYRLLSVLGFGGMGVVWKAWDDDLGRVVALKLLQAGLPLDQDAEERFRREVRLTARLQHVRIVRLLDAGLHEGRPYFTSEFIAGRSLADWRHANLPMATRIGWIRDMAEALQYAHEQGVIHRDIKPGNILIDEGCRPHLVDFGLALELGANGAGVSRTTASGARAGTPGYMSPEQITGQRDRLGPATDQFSLAMVLYELLVGIAPFAGNSMPDEALRILEADPVPLRTLNAKVPQDLETVCFKALEKDPGRRYRNMAEFAADLARVLDEEPIHAKPVSVVGQITHRLVRRRGAWGPHMLSVGALLASLWFGLHVARSRGTEAETLCRQARTHAAQRCWLAARDAYLAARTLDPGNVEAQDGFARADREWREGRD